MKREQIGAEREAAVALAKRRLPDADARAHGRGQVTSRCEPNEIFGREPIVWVGAQHTAVAVYRGDVVGAFIVRDGPNMFLAYGFGDRVLQ